MPRPALSAVAELLKPITWFPPMWAFACGVVASGVALQRSWLLIAIVASCWPARWCAPPARPSTTGSTAMSTPSTSRSAHSVRAHPGPLGALCGHPRTCSPWRGGVARALGLSAAALGLLLAWVYSAPPLRLKQNGWWGNAALRLVLRGAGLGDRYGGDAGRRDARRPDPVLALLYSIGAHGIMTLNDFKSVEGDRRMGVRSLPVQLGVQRAGPRGLPRHGAAAGRRGPAADHWHRRAMPRRSRCCCCRSSC